MILKKISHLLVFFLAWLGRYVFCWLPLKASVNFGAWLGKQAFNILTRDRKRTLANLEEIFSDSMTEMQRQELGKEIFANLGRCLFELFFHARTKGRYILSQVSFDGLEYLRQAYQQNKGIIYLTAHIGNWELMGGAVARTAVSAENDHPAYNFTDQSIFNKPNLPIERFRVEVIARDIHNLYVNRLLLKLRESLQVHSIFNTDPAASKKIFKTLKRGSILGFLIDQDTGHSGVFVPFFGKPAFTPRGPAAFAYKTDSPVIYGFITRDKKDPTRHLVTLRGPVNLPEGKDREELITEATTLFTAEIEGQIRNRPDQWVWMHRRWRRKP